MPRKPHFVLPGVPQHVIQRGNNREPCFYAEEDRANPGLDLCIKPRQYTFSYPLRTFKRT